MLILYFLYFLEIEEFAENVYPPYCSGWTVIYSQDVVFPLYKAAQKTKYFWVDDAHITGSLVKVLKLNHTNIQKFTLNWHDTARLINGNLTAPKTFFYARPNLNEKMIKTLWDYVLKNVDMDKMIESLNIVKT